LTTRNVVSLTFDTLMFAYIDDLHNKPNSYSRYRTGTSLQWRLIRGISLKTVYLHLTRLPALASVASYFHSNTENKKSSLFTKLDLIRMMSSQSIKKNQ